MRKIVLGILVASIGCTSTTDKTAEQASTKSDTITSQQTSSDLSTDTMVTPEEEKVVDRVLYEYRNDTIVQSLTVKDVSKGQISFTLTSFNRARNETSTLTGTATGKLDQDPETDTDEEGTAYAAIGYHFTKNDCSLSIRIALDNKDKARIKEYNCSKLHGSSCPFESVGLLKKKVN